MSGRSNIRNLSRAILVGSIAGLGLGACQATGGHGLALTTQSIQRDQAYNEALATRSAPLVTKFIRSHGSSADSATLLNQMPSNVLSQIPRSAVANLDDGVKRRLSARVRGQFGISLAASQAKFERGGGYGG
jgi:hypothetical protein